MDQTVQIEGFGMQVQMPGLDLGIVEDVVDDGQQSLARGADGFGKEALFFGQGGAAEQFGHAHDAVHRGPNLMAHVCKEGGFRAACRFGGGAGGAQGFLCLALCRDVGAQADAAPVGGGMVLCADPAAVGKVLFGQARGRAEFGDAFGKPFFFAADGIGVLACGEARAQDVFEAGTGLDGIGGGGIDVAVGLVADRQAVMAVEDHETIGDRLDRGAQAHFGGDVDGKADQIAVAGAPILQPDPETGAEGEFDGGDFIHRDAGEHRVDPVGGGLVGVDQEGGLFHECAIGHAGNDDAGGKGLHQRAVGKDQAVVAVENGKAIADGVYRGAQAAFGHDGGGMRAVQIAKVAFVLPLEAGRLGAGGAGGLAFFDDLLGQGAGLQRQLFIRRRQFTAFPFEMPFRRHARAAFLCQTFCQTHPIVPDRRCPLIGRAWSASGMAVNGG